MRITTSTISLTVADVIASRAFFVDRLGYRVRAEDEGFAALTRDDAVDIVLLGKGTEVLPPEQRDRCADGLIVAFTLETGLAEQERALRDAGVAITMPLREEPWGEKLFQVTDPNGVIVQFVEWV